MTVGTRSQKQARQKNTLKHVSWVDVRHLGVDGCLANSAGIIVYKPYKSPLSEPLWMLEIVLSVETGKKWREIKDSCLSTATAIYSAVRKCLDDAELDSIRMSDDNNSQPRRYLVLGKGNLSHRQRNIVRASLCGLFELPLD
jgi:hypothetical protein